MQYSSDALTWYLEEINKTQLLSASEEKKLGRLVQNGDEKAREILISSNLKFVVYIAKKFSNRGFPLSDLISAGNIGLIKAVDKFNPDNGCRFTSYAVAWIKQSISKALDYRTVRIPKNKKKSVIMIDHAKEDLRNKLDREPTLSEVAEIVDMDISTIDSIVNANNIIPLDSKIQKNGMRSSSVVEFIPSSDPSIEDVFDNVVLSDILDELMECLTDKELEIIQRRFGLNGFHPGSLTDIGKILGLSKERIRQIIGKGLRKINNHYKFEKLKDFMDE